MSQKKREKKKRRKKLKIQDWKTSLACVLVELTL